MTMKGIHLREEAELKRSVMYALGGHPGPAYGCYSYTLYARDASLGNYCSLHEHRTHLTKEQLDYLGLAKAANNPVPLNRITSTRRQLYIYSFRNVPVFVTAMGSSAT